MMGNAGERRQMEDSEEDWEEKSFFIPVSSDASSKSKIDEVLTQIDEPIREGWKMVFESDATMASIPEGVGKIDLRIEPPWTHTYGTLVTLQRRRP
jgi:hypothetical protein